MAPKKNAQSEEKSLWNKDLTNALGAPMHQNTVSLYLAVTPKSGTITTMQIIRHENLAI